MAEHRRDIGETLDLCSSAGESNRTWQSVENYTEHSRLMEDALIVALLLLPLMSVATESEPCCTLYAPWPQHIAPKIILCGPSSLFSYLSELLEIKSHRVIIFCFRDTLHRFRVYIQCCSMNEKVFAF